MKATDFKIGQKVNYITGTFMKNGIVKGIDENYNRVYVEWPKHGVSSICSENLIFA
jgi:transcription antitermination factor NusG